MGILNISVNLSVLLKACFIAYGSLTKTIEKNYRKYLCFTSGYFVLYTYCNIPLLLVPILPTALWKELVFCDSKGHPTSKTWGAEVMLVYWHSRGDPWPKLNSSVFNLRQMLKLLTKTNNFLFLLGCEEAGSISQAFSSISKYFLLATVLWRIWSSNVGLTD